MRRCLAAALWLVLGGMPGGAVAQISGAQAYGTLAGQPDPRDFMGRSGPQLTLLGDAVRFMGYDIGWLGMPASGRATHVLSAYEVQDALATVQALGGTVLRARPIGTGAGCAACATPSRAGPDPAALAALDLVLKVARDMGLKVIIPLAGDGDCAADPALSECVYPQARGQAAGTFFTDPDVRADFLAGVAAILAHVNALTGIAYRDDPVIMMWENCSGCGARADPAAVSTWAESVGRAIKAADLRHLYESGAFAGRIGPVAGNAVPTGLLATPSVDVVGDDLLTGSDPTTARNRLDATAAGIAAAAKVYVLDSIGWTPAIWKTEEDLDAWSYALLRQRALSGVVAGRLEGHADAGGYLPPSAAVPSRGVAALYFPGVATPDMDAPAMTERGRALRRLAYGIADIVAPPAYLRPPRPEIIAAKGGHLLWRGSAGAATYTIERSPDPSAPGTWEVVCDACATDLGGGWQDPSPLSPPAWYRITPANINGHLALPSEAAQAVK